MPILNAKLSDIVSFFRESGYKVVYKANNENEMYGDTSFSAEIPEDLRINFSVNLMLVRSSIGLTEIK